MNQSVASSKGVQTHWPSLVQFILSALIVFLAWGLAAGVAVLGLVELVYPQGDPLARTELFLSAAALFSVGLMLLPSALLALMRILGRSFQPPQILVRAKNFGRRVSLIILLPILFLGQWASQSESLDWLFLPPIHLFASALIVLWLVGMAVKRLHGGSAQRLWGVFASGLVLGPLFAFGLELLFGLFFLLLVALYVGNRPDLGNAAERLMESGAPFLTDPNQMLPMLQPFLSDPALLLIGLAFIALVVPMIEETFKPIGVWLLLKRPLAPEEGFALGVISGAGFALLENLALGANGESWLPIMAARIGTTAMHLLTAGLMGWALVIARNEKRYLHLLGVYALAVVLHGLWNGMVVLASLASFAALSGIDLLPLQFAAAAGLALLVLAGGSILLLRLSNRSLLANRRSRITQPSQHPIA